MGAETIIAWTDHTFNAWLGCQRVSEGCRNCYAETLARTRMGKPELWKGQRQVTKGPWQNVRKWNRAALRDGVRRRVFCGSMMDWAEDHPTAAAARPALWDLIRECTALDWQMLSKRPERIEQCLPLDWGDGWDHVWLGATVEDERVMHRIDTLRSIPARTRFISAEPLIGPLPGLDLVGIDWVIVGGESGPGHRLMDQAWAREIRDLCVESAVAFFFKQDHGARTEMRPWLVEEDGSRWVWHQYPGDLAVPRAA